MQDELDELRGRIVALELLVQNLMAAEIGDNFADPPNAVDEIRREMFASIQLVERTIDPRSDAAWDSTVTTLDRMFANVKKRLAAS